MISRRYGLSGSSERRLIYFSWGTGVGRAVQFFPICVSHIQGILVRMI